jgi:CHASE2 domain-containing sensor protein
LTLSSFLAAHLCFWLLPNVFEIWNAQAIDQLFVFRSSSRQLAPPYDDTIAHVDLSDTTIQRLSNHYLDRSHFAKVIGNLASMQVSAQVYDFIFAARKNRETDQALIDATAEAGNVYFGMAFELWQEGKPHREQRRHQEAIQGHSMLAPTPFSLSLSSPTPLGVWAH